MAKKYGIPYMGSKEKILNIIDDVFQREYNKEYFIDMFCGGFAVSSYALQNYKFKVLANDLNKYVIDLYREILERKGKQFNKVKFDWVSRKTFEQVRDNPEKFDKWYVGYVLTIWSFGNNQKVYLFGLDKEERKKALHQALVFNDWSLIEKDNEIKSFTVTEDIKKIDYKKNKNKRLYFMYEYKKHIKGMERLEQLERLQQLERLEQLEQLQRLELYECDWLDFYNSIPLDILENSFIYCDPPYENTTGYQVGDGFNYDLFWDWFRNCPYPVYVSSYTAPEDIITLDFTFKQVLMDNGNKEQGRKTTKKPKKENIYWNGKGNVIPLFKDSLFM